jgi:hypothetical protein
MEEYIIIDFSGWIKISPEKVKFVNIGSEEEKVISGAEWMKLNEDERGDYVLEDVIAAQRDCYDGSYDDISFTGYIEDEEGNVHERIR